MRTAQCKQSAKVISIMVRVCRSSFPIERKETLQPAPFRNCPKQRERGTNRNVVAVHFLWLRRVSSENASTDEWKHKKIFFRKRFRGTEIVFNYDKKVSMLLPSIATSMNVIDYLRSTV